MTDFTCKINGVTYVAQVESYSYMILDGRNNSKGGWTWNHTRESLTTLIDTLILAYEDMLRREKEYREANP